MYKIKNEAILNIPRIELKIQTGGILSIIDEDIKTFIVGSMIYIIGDNDEDMMVIRDF